MTVICWYLKEEAHDFLEQDTVRELIKKYSQFINFNIYLWGSSTQTVEEPFEDNEDEEERRLMLRRKRRKMTRKEL